MEKEDARLERVIIVVAVVLIAILMMYELDAPPSMQVIVLVCAAVLMTGVIFTYYYLKTPCPKCGYRKTSFKKIKNPGSGKAPEEEVLVCEKKGCEHIEPLSEKY